MHREISSENEPDLDNESKYLTFITDQQLYAIPISDVVQIMQIQEMTKVPGFPAYAKGIIHLRGEIATLIDMRLRLNKAAVGYSKRTCVVITRIHDTTFGLIVDEVDAVIQIAANTVSVPPRMNAVGNEGSYLTGIAQLDQGQKTVLLLDTYKVFQADDIRFLSEALNLAN